MSIDLDEIVTMYDKERVQFQTEKDNILFWRIIICMFMIVLIGCMYMNM